MKSSNLLFGILLSAFVVIESTAYCQQKPKEWNLQTCINYALENNIQIKKQLQSVEINKVDFEQSKAERLPNLNGEIGQSFTNQMAAQGGNQQQSVSGNISLQSQMVLYNGNKLNNTVMLNQLNVKAGELGVKESENSMELSITTAYLNILYARESVRNAENTLASSETQYQRAKTMFDAGYIAESNFAQVQSQYSNDKYALVVANNTMSQLILQLKQLLQLGIDDELILKFPEVGDSEVLKAIPTKQDVYASALKVMPEIENSKVNLEMAGLDLSIAKAGLLPSLSLSASAATGQNSLSSDTYATQLGNNFYQNAGLNLSIPIFNRKQVKSSVSKAQIGIETAKLAYAETQANLLTRVETAYLDALSSQSRFQAAAEQLKFTQISYSLIEDQFNLGMKNTVDLITEKNKYLSAQQEYLQAKYTAILNYKILDFYQDKPITL